MSSEQVRTVGALDLIQTTAYGMCEDTPGLLFQHALDIPNDFANEDAVNHILRCSAFSQILTC